MTSASGSAQGKATASRPPQNFSSTKSRTWCCIPRGIRPHRRRPRGFIPSEPACGLDSDAPIGHDMRLLASLSLCLAFAAGCRTRPTTVVTGATDIGFPSSSATGTAVYTGDRRPPTFPEAWQHKSGRAAVFGEHAMVASDAPLGSEAGVEILKRGGNAVDAAVAVGFALAVVYPEAGNIGGGGYTVIRMADGRSAALDYREIAPLAATRDMYLDAQGNKTDKSIDGHLASGVPGAVAGLTEALSKYGSKPLREVMAPAIRLAEDGFVLDSGMARGIR